MECKKTLIYDMVCDSAKYRITLNKKRLLIVIMSFFVVLSLLCLLLSLFDIVKIGSGFMGILIPILTGIIGSILIWLLVCVQIKSITIDERGVTIRNKTVLWAEIQKIEYLDKAVYFYTQPMIEKNLMPLVVEHRNKGALEILVGKYKQK